jgi:hypothetical protein
MKRISILLLLVALFITETKAQQMFPTYRQTNNDTLLETIQLNEATIVDKRTFSNDTNRYRYNQMRHYVKMILPLMDKAVAMFHEIDSKIATMNDRDSRKYIKSQEKAIKVNFEDQIRKLNVTQGKYLVKLINRQLGKNCYDIAKQLKNPVKAVYYQSWAKLNGINLNQDYIPEENRDLEMIMRHLGYPYLWNKEVQ